MDDVFLWKGWGGGLLTYVVACKQRRCSSLDDVFVLKGWRGWGGFRRTLARCCSVDDVFLWKGWGGGLLTFVVACKQRCCCSVDDVFLWKGWGGY